MFEKWKEKRTLEKQQKAARLHDVAQKFVNDALNPNFYVYRMRGTLLRLNYVGPSEYSVDSVMFHFKCDGDSVSVHSNRNTAYIFENTYSLGNCNFRAFLDEVCYLFNENDRRWNASVYYCSGGEGSIELYMSKR